MELQSCQDGCYQKQHAETPLFNARTLMGPIMNPRIKGYKENNIRSNERVAGIFKVSTIRTGQDRKLKLPQVKFARVLPLCDVVRASPSPSAHRQPAARLGTGSRMH